MVYCRWRIREPGPTRTVPPSLGPVTRAYPASRALGRSVGRAYGHRRGHATGYSASHVLPAGFKITRALPPWIGIAAGTVVKVCPSRPELGRVEFGAATL
jgi:hypothetical protein